MYFCIAVVCKASVVSTVWLCRGLYKHRFPRLCNSNFYRREVLISIHSLGAS